MANGQPHNDDVKASVIAALLQGQSAHSVARAYKLPRSTVRAWGKELKPSVALGSPQKAEIGDLISDYLRETLVTLRVQAEFFRNTTWLREQSASEVAVLHGVATDKAIRILEALDSGDDEEIDA